MSLKMNLKFAALLGDKVRHNKPRLTSAEKCFFGDLAM
jgi:hypothetical protein